MFHISSDLAHNLELVGESVGMGEVLPEVHGRCEHCPYLMPQSSDCPRVFRV